MTYYFEVETSRKATAAESADSGMPNAAIWTGRKVFTVEAADRPEACKKAKAAAAEIPGSYGPVGLMCDFDVWPMILRRVMEQRGETVRGLAEKASTGTTVITTWRNGTRFPTAQTLRKVADALGVTMDELFPAVGQ